jgi:hypothetical protein
MCKKYCHIQQIKSQNLGMSEEVEIDILITKGGFKLGQKMARIHFAQGSRITNL